MLVLDMDGKTSNQHEGRGLEKRKTVCQLVVYLLKKERREQETLRDVLLQYIFTRHDKRISQ